MGAQWVHTVWSLRCGGMLEAVRLLNAGFPTRCALDEVRAALSSALSALALAQLLTRPCRTALPPAQPRATIKRVQPLNSAVGES